ncbi:MAG: peroxidase family protein, partial [Shewanella sp.]
GDGRGNENIGLTAIHSVFHSEHNRLIEQYKQTIFSSGDIDVINRWLMPTHQITELPSDSSSLVWNGGYLFQAGRFANEMQYQHLVFEEFARTVQPDIDPFVFSNNTDINPAIFSEFANVVYRFGHSMLTEVVDRTDLAMQEGDIGLIEAFLNPVAFDSFNGQSIDERTAIGAIARGMTRQVGNEIDEFITEALRNNLVGLPLDLAAINIARGRDTLMPSLNDAREQFFALSGNSQLKPYTSWADFTGYLKNPTSIINFIAAYGQHETILAANNLVDKRAAATTLVLGQASERPEDALDFLNATGDWAGKETGLNTVDFWVGGLAERKNQFGGMLGSTFNFVFEKQMEMLQNGDRFYYLSRTQGLNMLNQLEGNSFAALVMRNSDLGDAASSHISAHMFQTPDHIFEVNQRVQLEADPTWGDAIKDLLVPLLVRRNAGNDIDSDSYADGAYLKYNGASHVVLGGSQGNDSLFGGEGIDSLWGDGGNDRLDGGDEADVVHGGNGNDLITDTGTPSGGADFLHGDAGHDVIFSGNGLDLLFGGQGQDFLVIGTDAQEIFAGEGNDFLLGGSSNDVLMGNEGDDWVEGGDGFDSIAGENSELFFNSSIIGHDVLNGQGNDTDYDGEAGDDIMLQGSGIQRSNGMAGFDWAIHKGDNSAANSDLDIPIFGNQNDFILRDRFDMVEGLSGWKYNDTLTGKDRPLGAAPVLGEAIHNYLTQAGADRIDGLQALLGVPRAANANSIVFNAQEDGSDILLGGGGSDQLTGRAGNDIIDGDAWLNVRIAVKDSAGTLIKSVDSMQELSAEMLKAALSPEQLHIMREIIHTSANNDSDTAYYRDIDSHYQLTRETDGSLSVSHQQLTDRRIDDGTDRLMHIEWLQFSDGSQIAVNQTAATGQLVINNTQPTVGELLRVDLLALSDANGLSANTDVQLLWQLFDGTRWQDQSVGNEFRVFTAQLDAPLRVVASFTDRLGFVETLISEPTAKVAPANDQPTLGLISLDDLSPTEGAALGINLTALSDSDGLNPDNFIYQWQANSVADPLTFNNIAGATDAVLLPTQALVGLQVQAIISVIDNENNAPIIFTTAVSDVMGDLQIGDRLANSLSGTAGADTLRGEGGNDSLTGLAGDDLLIGGAGADTLFGGQGQDVLQGSAGNDRLEGGEGRDSLFGGTGNDIYTVSIDKDQIIELANQGTDTINTDLARYLLEEHIERLAFIGTGDFITQANQLDNLITTGAGNDKLLGMAGNDTLRAGAGNDFIEGGVGNDILFGQAGNDIFAFGLASGRDTIRDFDANPTGGQDYIDLGQYGITTDNFAQRVTLQQALVGTATDVILDTDNIITLTGINKTSVTLADFKFELTSPSLYFDNNGQLI